MDSRRRVVKREQEQRVLEPLEQCNQAGRGQAGKVQAGKGRAGKGQAGKGHAKTGQVKEVEEVEGVVPMTP